MFASKWKLFGFLVEWTPATITIQVNRPRDKRAVRPSAEVNAVFLI